MACMHNVPWRDVFFSVPATKDMCSTIDPIAKCSNGCMSIEDNTRIHVCEDQTHKDLAERVERTLQHTTMEQIHSAHKQLGMAYV